MELGLIPLNDGRMIMRNIILDLCGGSGAWSRPYKDAGYDVLVCTLPQVNVLDISFGLDFNGHQDDCSMYIPGYPEKYVNINDIFGILAAPPCTEFSIAKNTRPRNFSVGMETVEACMRIIWEVRKRTKLNFWALENPRGLLRQFLGIPKYTFEQWEFGEAKIKATDIWGYFNIPASTVKNKPMNLTERFPNERANSRDWTKCSYPDEYETYIKSLKGYEAQRAAARAITPAGFAKAFFKANKLTAGWIGVECQSQPGAMLGQIALDEYYK